MPGKHGAPAIILALALAGAANGCQSTPPGPPAETVDTEPSPIERAVWRLADESRDVQINRELPAKPDFATRTDLEIPIEDVTAAIRRRHFRKAFIDSYIRWQLISFDPPLGEMDDAAFALFVQQTPSLNENPFSRHRTVRLMGAMVDRADLPEDEMTYVREREKTLNDDLVLVEQFNRPIIEFRAWVLERIEEPWRRAWWRLGDCHAWMVAGWPIAGTDVAARTEAALVAAAADPGITDEQRETLAGVVHELPESNRRVVTSIVYDETSINASIVLTGVDRETIERWEAIIAPPQESPKP